MISGEHTATVPVLGGEQQFEHQLTTDLGEVGLVGHCLATPAEFAAAAETALREGSVDQIQALPGSFSTIVSRQGEQTIIADMTGQFPIFWRPHGEGVRLSTDARELGTDVNPLYLAASILCCEQTVVRGQSAIDGVQRIEYGQTARFVNGRLASTEDPRLLPDYSLTIQDAAQNLREALTEAVERRIATGKVVTSDFSGGFDSTTLALLAAERAEDGLDAFIQYQPDVVAGDLPFARRIAAGNSHVRLHEQRQNANMLPFGDLLNVPLGDAPNPCATTNIQVRAMFELIQQYGSQIHMTGEGGDGVLTPPAKYLADLLRLGQHDRVMEIAQARSRLMHVDPTRVYGEALQDSERTLAEDLLQLAELIRNPVDLRTFKDPGRFSWLNLPEGNIELLHPEMRRRLGEQAERMAAEAPEFEPGTLSTYTSLSELNNGGSGLRHIRMIGRLFGTELHAPYFDKSVIDACLQTPAYERSEPGVFKYILQVAFKGILPDTLLSRTSKSAYNNELYHGLRSNWDGVIDLVTNGSQLAERGIIEPEVVLRELVRLDMGHTGLFPGIERLLSAEIWLRTLKGEQR